MDPAKIEAIRNWPDLKNVHEVRSFLGLCSYYRRYVRKFVEIASPLHMLTQKGVPFSWGATGVTAFQTLKDKMTTGPVLILPDLQKSFEVYCDACGRSLGAVLMQEGRVIAYESRLFSKPEMTAQIYEKELLAVIHALTQWRHYLLGADFTVFTNHQSLRYFLTQKQLSEKQMQWANILSQFHFQIVHVQGQKNVVADALSRKPLVRDQESLKSFVQAQWELVCSVESDVCSWGSSEVSVEDCVGEWYSLYGEDRPSLDDVERLSRGEASKGKIGSRAVPHRLNADERKAYELAKKKGYLVRQYRSREYPLSNTYRNYCDAVGWPNIRIDQGSAGSPDTLVVDLTTLRLEDGKLTALEKEMKQCIIEEFSSRSDQPEDGEEAPSEKHEATTSTASRVEFGEPKSGVLNFQFLRSDARHLCQVIQGCCKMYISSSVRKMGF
ncbi:hypothetical protein L7F22_018871 [Adiantum nelumboides]|nr:hypothetical protein [Adiantum nelumboides]